MVCNSHRICPRAYYHRHKLHIRHIAYDIYLEVAEGKLDRDWRLTYPVDFWTFCNAYRHTIVTDLIMFNHSPQEKNTTKILLLI